MKNASEGKWRPAALLYMKNLSQAEMFSPEFCEVFKNIFLQYPCILMPLKFEANLKFCEIQKFEILKIWNELEMPWKPAKETEAIYKIMY